MRRLLIFSSAALAACGSRAAGVEARWGSDEGEMELSAPARAGWCQDNRTVLLEGNEGGTAIGVVWKYDSLRIDSLVLRVPSDSDSVSSGASAALRYFALDEVRGFQSIGGTFHVTAVDPTTISARVSALLRRPGRTDSTELTAVFNKVPLVNDTMVCTR